MTKFFLHFSVFMVGTNYVTLWGESDEGFLFEDYLNILQKVVMR